MPKIKEQLAAMRRSGKHNAKIKNNKDQKTKAPTPGH